MVSIRIVLPVGERIHLLSGVGLFFVVDGVLLIALAPGENEDSLSLTTNKKLNGSATEVGDVKNQDCLRFASARVE